MRAGRVGSSRAARPPIPRRARLTLAVLATAFAAHLSHAGAIDQLKRFVETTRTAKASFRQTVVAKSGSRPQQASGTMVFSRPGRFRWTYEKPYDQLIVGDGERLWIYDRDLNQVTTRRLGEALGASPAALLAGENDIERNFRLSEAGASEGLEWLEAVPKSPESGFERMRIGFADGAMRRLELRDNFGQTTTLVFSELARNPKLDPELFRFTPPKGADVISD